MTILNFRAANEPVSRQETITIRGSNNAIGSRSLSFHKDRIGVAFSAKANLTAVLHSPAIISDLLATEARAALRRIEKRDGEDIETWANNIGADLGSFKD